MANTSEELRKEDFERAAGEAKAKAAEFRQQTVDGANNLRQQAADGLGSLQETLKGKGDSGSTVDSATNKAAQVAGAGKDKVEPTVADKAKSTMQKVKEAVVPTAHAGELTPEEQHRRARAHLHAAQDDMDKAGQHVASATQTVAHDVRSAADQASQAASHIGHRFATSAQETGQSAADKAGQAQDSAREGAEHTKEEAKSLYASAKDTLSGWLGGKEHAGHERKDDVDRAVEGTQDAIARNVNKASDTVKGAFQATGGKADEMRAKAPGSEDVKGEARSALDTAEDAAIRTKNAVVDTAKYVGRLTAPAGGEASGDRKVREGQRDMQGAADKAKEHGHGLMDRAREAYGDAKHQVSESVEDAKHRVSETAEQARQRARDAAERARPHTVEEAEKSEGYPPSNTASLRARKMEGHGKEGLARAEAPTASQLEDKTARAMESAGDLATRTKDAVVDTAKYIGGRLTAPAGGDASDAHGTVDSAKARAATAADKAGDHSRGALEHGKGMMEQAKEAVGDATHQVSESVKDAKARLTQAAEDAARSAQEAADSVRPHTAEEADLAQGLPPSNTADLLAERAAASDPNPSPATDSLASKVVEGWGGEQLSGDSNMESLRAGLNRRA